jgi:ABC-type nickel/cobalt efflux system permease component RcnA
VYILLCMSYPYSGCRRLKQSSIATYKVSRIQLRGPHLGEAPASEVHTSGVHTPLKDNHTKTPDLNLDPDPNSHLRCGAHLLLPPHLNGRSRAHSLGGEKKHKRRVASQVRDRKTVHNQWTWTIAIGLTLCRGCTTVPARIGPEPAVTGTRPYHAAERQVSG